MRRGSPKLHITTWVNATRIAMSGESQILERMLIIALK